MIRVPPWQRRLELGQKPKVVSPVPAQTSRTRTWLRGGTKLLFSTYLLPVHLWRLCTTQLRACNARRIFASMMLYQAACTYVSRIHIPSRRPQQSRNAQPPAAKPLTVTQPPMSVILQTLDPLLFPRRSMISSVEGLSHNDAAPDKLSHDTTLDLTEACSMILSWLDAYSHSDDGTPQKPRLDIADRVVFPSVLT
jgi:hypothetical protein